MVHTEGQVGLRQRAERRPPEGLEVLSRVIEPRLRHPEVHRVRQGREVVVAEHLLLAAPGRPHEVSGHMDEWAEIDGLPQFLERFPAGAVHRTLPEFEPAPRQLRAVPPGEEFIAEQDLALGVGTPSIEQGPVEQEEVNPHVEPLQGHVLPRGPDGPEHLALAGRTGQALHRNPASTRARRTAPLAQ